jgi:hypothetical protein
VGTTNLNRQFSIPYGTNNRVTAADQAAGGYTYSASGNVLNDGINQYTYDAASRILTVSPTVLHSVTAQYVYDAEGHRVARLNGAGSLTASWVLGPGGEQMTEMNGSGGWVHSNIFAGKLLATYDANGTHFQAGDWLGTRRAQISATGALELGFQSLPFGDGLTPVAGCALLPGGPCATNATDSTEHHFTGKERDTESGRKESSREKDARREARPSGSAQAGQCEASEAGFDWEEGSSEKALKRGSLLGELMLRGNPQWEGGLHRPQVCPHT